MSEAFDRASGRTQEELVAQIVYRRFMETASELELRGVVSDDLYKEYAHPPTPQNTARFAFSRARLLSSDCLIDEARAEIVGAIVPAFRVVSSIYHVRVCREMLSGEAGLSETYRREGFDTILLAHVLRSKPQPAYDLGLLNPETFVPYLEEGMELADKKDETDADRRARIRSFDFSPLIGLALGARSEFHNYIRFRQKPDLGGDVSRWGQEFRNELRDHTIGADTAVFMLNAALEKMKPTRP